MIATKVILSDGRTGDDLPPRPAAMFVSVDLGHRFRALPIDEQRRAVEAALEDALTIAHAKLDAMQAAVSGESVAA